MPFPSLAEAKMDQNFSNHATIWHLPESVAEALRDGQTTLKALREWRALTSSQLSDLSGVDLVLLMMAERGSDLLPEEWMALARTLRVEVSVLTNSPPRPTALRPIAQDDLDRAAREYRPGAQ
jgi:hypothetical protein